MAQIDPYVPALIGFAGVLVGAVSNGLFTRAHDNRRERRALRSTARLRASALLTRLRSSTGRRTGTAHLIEPGAHTAVDDKALAHWEEAGPVLAESANVLEWGRIRLGFRMLRDVRGRAEHPDRHTPHMVEVEPGVRRADEVTVLNGTAARLDRLALAGETWTNRFVLRVFRAIEGLLYRAEENPSRPPPGLSDRLLPTFQVRDDRLGE